jgi:type II secretory pathway pseudopilin PulG
MSQLALVAAPAVPVLVNASGARAQIRFLEFFAANIRNKNTRRAYAQATREFLAWCESAGVASIDSVQPLHVAAYIEQLIRADRQAAPGRDPAFVRLAGDGSDYPCESGLFRARAVA